MMLKMMMLLKLLLRPMTRCWRMRSERWTPEAAAAVISIRPRLWLPRAGVVTRSVRENRERRLRVKFAAAHQGGGDSQMEQLLQGLSEHIRSCLAPALAVRGEAA